MDAVDHPPPPAWHATAGGGAYRALAEDGVADGASAHARLTRGVWGFELGGRVNLRPEHLSVEEELPALLMPDDYALVPYAESELWSARALARVGPDGPAWAARDPDRAVWGGPFLAAGVEVRGVQSWFVEEDEAGEVVIDREGPWSLSPGMAAGVGFGLHLGRWAGVRALVLDHLAFTGVQPVEHTWSAEVALELPTLRLGGGAR